MPSKKIWTGVLPLSILVALIGGLILLGKIGGKIDQDIIEDGIEANGVAFDEGKRMINIRYTIDGKEYIKGVGKPFSYIQNGEEFLLKYLPTDPSSIVVFFDKPILSNQYRYLETDCTSINKSLSVIIFQYNVNGEVIKRETLFRDNQSLNPADYVIKYRFENPKIGYLIKM